ncbi:(2Fe-2S)-binding protein [Vulgatibacter incomptus]|uniref:Sarcosine oxidase alpha subunit n=1 Tax=Vulgatibacter incomptus TaxID=1391653 RepID=A0A0K1PA83_9BACT|nr:(2Fe-2S)-binding protein [Vulgatibacter incomptus]AKU90412.1 Sarcosine oxidase alpha subunit [Vulgatibacter incomptus]
MAKAERLSGGPAGREIRLEFEGEPIPAKEGEPIAASLLAAGVEVFSRAVKYHRARGPYCLSGRCSHCVMRVDGEPNVYTCITPAREGCKIERQNAFPGVDRDVFRTIDWMYPKGLDHHTLFAGVPLVEKVVATVARQMAGLGLLPDEARREGASFLEHRTDILVVGGGSAGTAAALAAAKVGGAAVTLVDEQGTTGGRLQTGLYSDERNGSEAALRQAGVHLFTRTFAFGLYREDGILVAAKAPGRRLLVIRPKVVILAAGATELLAPFGNNELPGVFAGRALARLVTRDGILPGREVVVAGHGPERDALAKLLVDAGAELRAVVGLRGCPEGQLLRAVGRSKVAGAVIANGPGRPMKVGCDLIAVAGETSAFLDLARHAGAHVDWRDGGFAVRVDERFSTGVPGVLACGEMTGTCTPIESRRQGDGAGRTAVALLAVRGEG